MSPRERPGRNPHIRNTTSSDATAASAEMAAGAVSPQERLTSTHDIEETEKKPPIEPAASGAAGEQLNLNNAGTPINSGIFAAVAQPVRAAVS